jgi:hypothetical protein
MQFDSTLAKCNHHSGYPGQNPVHVYRYYYTSVSLEGTLWDVPNMHPLSPVESIIITLVAQKGGAILIDTKYFIMVIIFH